MKQSSKSQRPDSTAPKTHFALICFTGAYALGFVGVYALYQRWSPLKSYASALLERIGADSQFWGVIATIVLCALLVMVLLAWFYGSGWALSRLREHINACLWSPERIWTAKWAIYLGAPLLVLLCWSFLAPLGGKWLDVLGIYLLITGMIRMFFLDPS